MPAILELIAHGEQVSTRSTSLLAQADALSAGRSTAEALQHVLGFVALAERLVAPCIEQCAAVLNEHAWTGQSGLTGRHPERDENPPSPTRAAADRYVVDLMDPGPITLEDELVALTTVHRRLCVLLQHAQRASAALGQQLLLCLKADPGAPPPQQHRGRRLLRRAGGPQQWSAEAEAPPMPASLPPLPPTGGLTKWIAPPINSNDAAAAAAPSPSSYPSSIHPAAAAAAVAVAFFNPTGADEALSTAQQATGVATAERTRVDLALLWSSVLSRKSSWSVPSGSSTMRQSTAVQHASPALHSDSREDSTVNATGAQGMSGRGGAAALPGRPPIRAPAIFIPSAQPPSATGAAASSSAALSPEPGRCRISELASGLVSSLSLEEGEEGPGGSVHGGGLSPPPGSAFGRGGGGSGGGAGGGAKEGVFLQLYDPQVPQSPQQQQELLQQELLQQEGEGELQGEGAAEHPQHPGRSLGWQEFGGYYEGRPFHHRPESQYTGSTLGLGGSTEEGGSALGSEHPASERGVQHPSSAPAPQHPAQLPLAFGPSLQQLHTQQRQAQALQQPQAAAKPPRRTVLLSFDVDEPYPVMVLTRRSGAPGHAISGAASYAAAKEGGGALGAGWERGWGGDEAAPTQQQQLQRHYPAAQVPSYDGGLTEGGSSGGEEASYPGGAGALSIGEVQARGWGALRRRLGVLAGALGQGGPDPAGGEEAHNPAAQPSGAEFESRSKGGCTSRAGSVGASNGPDDLEGGSDGRPGARFHGDGVPGLRGSGFSTRPTTPGTARTGSCFTEETNAAPPLAGSSFPGEEEELGEMMRRYSSDYSGGGGGEGTDGSSSSRGGSADQTAAGEGVGPAALALLQQYTDGRDILLTGRIGIWTVDEKEEAESRDSVSLRYQLTTGGRAPGTVPGGAGAPMSTDRSGGTYRTEEGTRHTGATPSSRSTIAPHSPTMSGGRSLGGRAKGLPLKPGRPVELLLAARLIAAAAARVVPSGAQNAPHPPGPSPPPSAVGAGWGRATPMLSAGAVAGDAVPQRPRLHTGGGGSTCSGSDDGCIDVTEGGANAATPATAPLPPAPLMTESSAAPPTAVTAATAAGAHAALMVGHSSSDPGLQNSSTVASLDRHSAHAELEREVGALGERFKAATTAMHQRLRNDNKLLDDTADQVDKNLDNIGRAQDKMDEETTKQMAGLCEILALLLAAVLIFFAAYVAIRVLPKPVH